MKNTNENDVSEIDIKNGAKPKCLKFHVYYQAKNIVNKRLFEKINVNCFIHALRVFDNGAIFTRGFAENLCLDLNLDLMFKDTNENKQRKK